MTIFIDESGTLPDPKDAIVIIAAIGIKKTIDLVNVYKAIRKQMRAQKKSKNIPEIKFYTAGEKTKIKFLKELSKQDINIFILIIKKEGQKILDTPEHFALLNYILIEECLLFYKEKIAKIVFDKHFHKQLDQKKFNQILKKITNKNFLFEHVDSQKDVRVNAADMIAGSALWAYTGKDSAFMKLSKAELLLKKFYIGKKPKDNFWK